MKRRFFLIYTIPLIFIAGTIYYLLSNPDIENLVIKESENFTIVDLLGDAYLIRNDKEFTIKDLPLVLSYKDIIKTHPFSGLTILCPDSSLILLSPSTEIILENNFLTLHKGSIEWKNVKRGLEIHLKNGIILHTSEAGIVESSEKISIVSSKKRALLRMDNKSQGVEEFKRVIFDKGKQYIEELEKPPELISPKNNEIYGDWKEDFGVLKLVTKGFNKNDSLLLEVSLDPYFINRILSIPFREEILQLPLERIGTGKRFVRVSPYGVRKSGLPSETVEFTVRAFPLAKASLEEKLPRIDIYSVIVSGNIVIVKGKVERGSRLFINKEEITPEPNGEFNVPVSFDDIGEKWIEIEAIFPNGLRSFKRQRVFLVGY